MSLAVDTQLSLTHTAVTLHGRLVKSYSTGCDTFHKFNNAHHQPVLLISKC